MTYDFDTVEISVEANGQLAPEDYVRLTELSEVGFEIKSVAIAGPRVHVAYLQRRRNDDD
jgi:hypothetical protein